MQELIDNVVDARGPGLQSHEEVCANVLGGVNPETWRIYREAEPDSAISVAYARARFKRTALMKGKASKIANDDKHPRQMDALKFLLTHLGGDEFAEKVTAEMTGPNGGPLNVKMPSVAQFLSAVAKARKKHPA